jgi:prefoldin beta subunit
MVTEADRQVFEQFQAYQQQLQSVLIQKENLKLQMLDIDKAVEELETSKEKEAYKIAGPIMIKKTSEDLKKELKEKKENFDLRIKSLEKAEERMVAKLKELEPKLKSLLKEE